MDRATGYLGRRTGLGLPVSYMANRLRECLRVMKPHGQHLPALRPYKGRTKSRRLSSTISFQSVSAGGPNFYAQYRLSSILPGAP